MNYLNAGLKCSFVGHINNFIIEKKTEKIFENIHDYNSSRLQLQFIQEKCSYFLYTMDVYNAEYLLPTIFLGCSFINTVIE